MASTLETTYKKDRPILALLKTLGLVLAVTIGLFFIFMAVGGFLAPIFGYPVPQVDNSGLSDFVHGITGLRIGGETA